MHYPYKIHSSAFPWGEKVSDSKSVDWSYLSNQFSCCAYFMLKLLKSVYHRSMREIVEVTKFKCFIFSVTCKKCLYCQPIHACYLTCCKVNYLISRSSFWYSEPHTECSTAHLQFIPLLLLWMSEEVYSMSYAPRR
jgi:hypothetical protein